MKKRELAEHLSLEVLDFDGNIIYESSGKWLHPLLDLEKFLKENSLDTSKLILHDRIAGRAAASLAVLMNFKYIKLSLASSLALEIYKKYDVYYKADKIVERILCKTEELISSDMSLVEVYDFINQRAKAALAKANF
jgi:hypothetical protein